MASNTSNSFRSTEMEKHFQSFHLFNCDSTFNLDSVEALLLQMNGEFGLHISVVKRYFPLSQMSEMCSTTIPELQMDYAVFVVHVNESRLSINENNAGIGYAKIYRALLKATGGKVLIVIGRDDNYENDEEDQAVISRWVRRKIQSQFNQEFLDGRKSFIFSWNKNHRPIHEEALLHYFDPEKAGQKFVPKPKPKPQPIVPPEPPAPVFSGDDKKQGSTADSCHDDDDKESGAGVQVPISVPDGSSQSIYPEGIVLLQTRMRYGQISYEERDVVVWDRKWRPSEIVVRGLERDNRAIPEATLQMIADGAGGVQRSIVRDVTTYYIQLYNSFPVRFLISVVGFFVWIFRYIFGRG